MQQEYFFCLFYKTNLKNLITVRCTSQYLYINGENLRDINTELKKDHSPSKDYIKMTTLDREFLAIMLRKNIEFGKAIITKEEFLKLLLKHAPERTSYTDSTLRNRLNNVSSRLNKLFKKKLEQLSDLPTGVDTKDMFGFIHLYGVGKKSLHPNIGAFEVRSEFIDNDIAKIKETLGEEVPEYVEQEMKEFKKSISYEKSTPSTITTENRFLEELAGTYYIFEMSYLKKDKIERIPMFIEASGYITRKAPNRTFYKGQLTIKNDILYVNLFSDNAVENVYMIYDISLLLIEDKIEDLEIISGITLALTNKNEPIARASVLVKMNKNYSISSENIAYFDVLAHGKTNNFFQENTINESLEVSGKIRKRLQNIAKDEILRVTS